MPATGLKLVGTGACLPWCSISFSFQNSLKTYWHQGYAFLEFWCWNLVPFLPDIGFQLLKSLSLTYFLFNDAPNVLYRWMIWTAGSTRTLLLRSHAVVIAALYGFALSCWNARRLEGSICCSKTFIYLYIHSAFQNMQAAHTLCTYAPPYHKRYWLLNRTLMTCWKVSLLFSLDDTASVISNKNVKFGLLWA